MPIQRSCLPHAVNNNVPSLSSPIAPRREPRALQVAVILFNVPLKDLPPRVFWHRWNLRGARVAPYGLLAG